MIQDSGDRTEFPSGAVRDIQEGKGRCDLLPLGEVADVLQEDVLLYLEQFQKTGGRIWLPKALKAFAEQRGINLNTLILEVAIHFEEGAKKYGENNWRQGIPVHCYIDSAVRHLLKDRRGDTDERHDRAFAWNILCCMWTIANRPEMCDIPAKEGK